MRRMDAVAAPVRYLADTTTYPRGDVVRPTRAHLASLMGQLSETEARLLRRWLVGTLHDLCTADLMADVVRPISYAVGLMGAFKLETSRMLSKCRTHNKWQLRLLRRWPVIMLQALRNAKPLPDVVRPFSFLFMNCGCSQVCVFRLFVRAGERCMSGSCAAAPPVGR